MGDAARDRMLREIVDGTGGSASGDASGKYIIARGCDPQMAARAGTMLPPLLGNANIESFTDDVAFFKQLRGGRKYDVVFFAPGACRYSAAKSPIPGGNEETRGWGLDEYKAVVREAQGDVPIVETTKEPEIVPLLRRALGLP
jgi:hypothetical protein